MDRRSPTGRPNQARATLLDIWEIDRKLEVANNGGGVQISNELIAKDQPPIDHASTPRRARRAGTAVELTANVTDDGIPPERKPRPPRPLGAVAARERPAVAGQRAAAARNRVRRRRLSVIWMIYRGPAGATFDPDGYVKVADGKAAVKATFSKPGTYIMRAFAHDGLCARPPTSRSHVDAAKSNDR